MSNPRISGIRQFADILRAQQYIKNIFILAPLFFALEFGNAGLLLNALIAAIAFSLSASGVYVMNDLLDIAEDREHPTKRDRPIAAGQVSTRSATMMSVGLLLVGGAIMVALSPEAAAILSAYVLLNIAYSLWLKHIAILDVAVIATGFVLRLFVGAAVTGIPLSMWIVTITFLLALFMALAKRRSDVLLFINTGARARKVIDGYNLRFLDSAISIMASVVIVSYILYTTSSEVIEKLHSNYLYLTALFVILGILRYMQITFVDENSESPTEILWKDRFIQLNSLAWIMAFGWILYL